MEGVNPSWRGANQEVVYEFLRLHLPAEKIDFDIAGEKPSKAEDVRPELAKCQKQQRDMMFLMWIFLFASLALLVSLWGRAKLAGFCFVMFFVGMHGVVIWLANREYTKTAVKLERWLAELQAKEAL
jgi:hypothetical protein